MRTGFAYVWEFRVREGAERLFLEVYGPEGSWVRLFSMSDGYLGTELLQDDKEPARFLTIDRWRSRADRDTFRKRFETEYTALDAECESLTDSEHLIGEFDLISM